MDTNTFPIDYLPGSVMRFLTSDWGTVVIALLIVALVVAAIVATRLWTEVRQAEEELERRRDKGMSDE